MDEISALNSTGRDRQAPVGTDVAIKVVSACDKNYFAPDGRNVMKAGWELR